jgi:hypothetical protein
MTIKTNAKKRVLMFGDFIAAAYRALGAGAGRKNLCGWPSRHIGLCFAGDSAL